MRLLKSVLRSEQVRRALCWLGAAYIRFAHLSGRWRTVGGETPEAVWAEGKPFILCFWHGRLLMMPRIWRPDRVIHMLISEHRDGQLIANTVAHFGIDTVVGSSSKGGTQALRAMVGALRRGECVGITPDGPRGPRMRATDGVVSLARLSGVPIIPATFSVSSGRVLGSWDRFLVAAPFSRGVFVWGAPITVDRAADAQALEAARLRVEDSLNAITREADRLVDRPAVEPAPLGDAGAVS